MEIQSCYKIGYVARTHGLKGEVTIILDPSLPPLADATTIFIEVRNSLVPYFINHISDRGDKAFVKFDEVDTPEEAAKLKGCSLYLPKKVRPKLGRGEFYDDEIVGFEVVDKHLGILGKVTEVTQAGANPLLTVAGSSKEILIPILGPFITTVNKTQKRVTVELPDGFLEI